MKNTPFLPDITLCPNRECPNNDKLKAGEKCPTCGTETKTFAFKEATDLRIYKKQLVKINEKLEKGSIQLLTSDNMTDAEIKSQIKVDMINLAGQEAGTGWMHLGTLISGNSTDQILGAGLKAIIDQNKIIIRQNELVLRVLSKK